MSGDKRRVPSRNSGRNFTKNYKDKWNSKAFLDLSPEQHAFLDYLESGPASNAIGCYHASLPRLRDEFHVMARGRFTKLFNQCKKIGLFQYDDETNVVYLRKMVANNPPQNPDAVRMFANMVKRIPNECPFKPMVIQAIWRECDESTDKMRDAYSQHIAPLETLLKPLIEPNVNTVSHVEENISAQKNQKTREKAQRSTPTSTPMSTPGPGSAPTDLQSTANRGYSSSIHTTRGNNQSASFPISEHKEYKNAREADFMGNTLDYFNESMLDDFEEPDF